MPSLRSPTTTIARRSARWAAWGSVVVLSLGGFSAAAQTGQPTAPSDAFYTGEILEVVSEQRAEVGIVGGQSVLQTVKVRITDGPQAGRELEIEYGALSEAQRLEAGERVVLLVPDIAEPERVYVFDAYRLSALYLSIAAFIVLTVVLARGRGAAALAGLAFSVVVLAWFVVPRIMAGDNPLFVSLWGSLFIATVSIYLAHGFNRRTSVALAGTLITVVIAIGCAVVFVHMTKLFGLGSEEAFYLQLAPINRINLRGLLLGGIIIGALGVLDDITTAQAAAVQELSRANPALSRKELFHRGFSIGREHITSLVNTLVLAYAGASFPALLVFTVYQRPLWVVLNTEVIAEEIIRTLVGSIALMCAVPITTLLAAYFLRQPASIAAGTHQTPTFPYTH